MDAPRAAAAGRRRRREPQGARRLGGRDRRPVPARRAARTRIVRDGRRVVWSDGWDGYPAARLRLLGFLREIGARSCVVVTGDNHVNYVADLKTDFADLEAEPVATELCGTSISSPGPLEGHVPNVLRENPHIKHGDGTQRGYMVVDVTPERAVARLRVIDDPADRLTGVAAQATFAIEAGRPGAQAVTGAAARTGAAGGRT